MFKWLKTRKKVKSVALPLYKKAVMASRRAEFFTDLGVPDTLDGRFDLICLHVFLVVDKANEAGDPELGQAIFDVMFKDVDRSLREMGIGDLGVPKHIKKMMKAFNGRAHAYKESLTGTERNLEEVVKNNIYGTIPNIDSKKIEKMKQYIKKNYASIQMQSEENFLKGEVEFQNIDTSGEMKNAS
ncbi:MAG: ubiquinol-cytochrome C chaperone family protein [Alphaproteobacteria bacterium]|nr:ubiquinol-cytochrome C chaperone family protein [Alphaproteobacteria bacterium]